MARRKKKDSDEFTTSWLDTYADTITLLMTFFVLLYSLSSVDAQKVKQVSNAFNEIMSGSSADSILQYDLYNGKVPLVGGESSYEDLIEATGGQTQTYEEVKDFVNRNDLSSTVSITEDERGIILQLRDNILFETGQADLKAESMAILDKINVLISTLPNSIIIEGHTDNVPIKTSKFDSNWELSATRATKVLRYFTEGKGQNANRFSATGYGETRPLVHNTSAENRAQNRRVNILIVANNKE
ncbi:OmpA family protein [Clostridium paraputrificum]|uniref:OmpA family protein n=1 Tax=Clostridium TaxID=1485 RepID=UPI003D349EFF